MKKIIFILLSVSMLAVCYSTNRLYAYTDREHQIYTDMMNIPLSVSESQAHAELSKKYGIPATEIEMIVRRVMKELSDADASTLRKREEVIKQIVGKYAEVKTVVIAGDFANISYIEKRFTWNDADMKEKVVEHMPTILEDVFSVEGIERVRFTAYHPAADGAEKKVAGCEVSRQEFKPWKQPSEYENYWDE